MKKSVILLLCGLLMTGCGKSAADLNIDPSANSADTTKPPMITSFPVSDGKHQPRDLDMSKYSENAKIYTGDDIYIESIQCGYVSNMPRNLLITDQEQLEYARELYPLFIPEDADDQTRWLLQNAVIDPFNAMTEKYPVSEYDYLLSYESFVIGTEIYAGGILVDNDFLFFINAQDCVYPDYGDTTPDAEEGACHIAAVPKDLLDDYLSHGNASNWIIPDRNNMYQDKDYFFKYGYKPSASLYDIYGDTNYIIRSVDELSRFKQMSSHLKDTRNNSMLDFLSADFSKSALLVRFTQSDEKFVFLDDSSLTISGNNINMDLSLGDDYPNGKKGGTYIFYASIPLRFLTEDNYDSWVAPPQDVCSEFTPVIDTRKYSKDAVILTTDDIYIGSVHSRNTQFSGNYIIYGEDGTAQVWDGLGLGKDNNFVDFVELNLYNFDFDKYPDSINNFLFVQYKNFENGSPELYPYALVIDGNKAEFVYSELSDSFVQQPDSYLFCAAVPEELINNVSFDGWDFYN